MENCTYFKPGDRAAEDRLFHQLMPLDQPTAVQAYVSAPPNAPVDLCTSPAETNEGQEVNPSVITNKAIVEGFCKKAGLACKYCVEKPA